MVKLEEMVGKGKAEEELEGEVIDGPSGEVVEPLSLGKALSLSLELNYLSNHTVSMLHWFPFFFQKLIYQIKTSAYQIFQPDPPCLFGIVSSADESSKSEKSKVTREEKYEVDWAHLWIEETGGASLMEEEMQQLLSQVFLFTWYCLDSLTVLFIVLWLSLAFVTDPFPLLQGLYLLS